MAEENPWLLVLGLMAFVFFTVYLLRCESRICKSGMALGVLASVFVLLEMLNDLRILSVPQSFLNTLAIPTFLLFGIALLVFLLRRSEFSTE